MAITAFTGKYELLSLYSYSDVKLDGEVYPCVECAYFASKTKDPVERKLFQDIRPQSAKITARHVTKYKKWESERLGILEGLLEQKFAPGTPERELLNSTKGEELVHGNTWHDNFLGFCTCPICATKEHHNHLGRMLMKIRDKEES